MHNYIIGGFNLNSSPERINHHKSLCDNLIIRTRVEFCGGVSAILKAS
jgi:hypothetical protein